MGRRAEVVLYRIYIVDGRRVMFGLSEVGGVGHERLSHRGSRGPITFATEEERTPHI
jgi:hypothetical protein